MIASYEQLHRSGFGHSVETYRDNRLVGGLYGLQLGGVFFGESMFSLERDASKVAVARLVAECGTRDIQLIDCQVASAHLASLGRARAAAAGVHGAAAPACAARSRAAPGQTPRA